jgi:hypothetical protein
MIERCVELGRVEKDIVHAWHFEAKPRPRIPPLQIYHHHRGPGDKLLSNP